MQRASIKPRKSKCWGFRTWTCFMWTKHRIPIQQLECNFIFYWNFHTPLKSWGDFLKLCCRCKIPEYYHDKKNVVSSVDPNTDRQAQLIGQMLCTLRKRYHLLNSLGKKKNTILWQTYLNGRGVYTPSMTNDTVLNLHSQESLHGTAALSREFHTQVTLLVWSLPQLKGSNIYINICDHPASCFPWKLQHAA